MSASQPLFRLQAALAGVGIRFGRRLPWPPSGALSFRRILTKSRTHLGRPGNRRPTSSAAACAQVSRPRAGAWPLVLAAGLGLSLSLLGALPVRAGSATAESVWDRRNARARALEQVPRGAVITREACMEIGMRGNEERYRCTIWYAMPPNHAPQP